MYKEDLALNNLQWWIYHKTQTNRDVFWWCNSQSAGLRNRSKRVRTPAALFRLLSDKYPWARHRPYYSLAMALNIAPLLSLYKGGFDI